jgi:alpha-D-ribose 1-methylphosphonate 5-triphosphate synthase subunit PhnH
MSLTARVSNLLPGFSDPVLDSQRIFRHILDAMSHPGKRICLTIDLEAPVPFHQATAAIGLTLLDFETPLWTDVTEDCEAVHWLRFHCGCPWTALPSRATYAFISNGNDLPSLNGFNAGKDEYPARSATLIIQVADLASGETRTLRGPGIPSAECLSVQGLSEEFWSFWRINHGLFPLGVDVLLTSGRHMVALPRTIEIGE